MSKYMIKASYSTEGIKGVMDKGGTARADAIGKLAASVGGALEEPKQAIVIDAGWPSEKAVTAIRSRLGK